MSESRSGETGRDAGGGGRWRLLSELELLDLFLFPFLLFYLGYLLALALIVAFSLHFVLRSFWVAIAGLNQVFPTGIDWGRLDVSPIAKKIARQSFPTTRELLHPPPLAARGLELNGESLRLDFSFYRHRETGVRGLRAYLPTAGLPAGRNVLAIHRDPSRAELERAADDEERRWLERRGSAYIPFWK